MGTIREWFTDTITELKVDEYLKNAIAIVYGKVAVCVFYEEHMMFYDTFSMAYADPEFFTCLSQAVSQYFNLIPSIKEINNDPTDNRFQIQNRYPYNRKNQQNPTKHRFIRGCYISIPVVD